MASLSNVWHVPANPEPPERAGMRDPLFPTTPIDVVTIPTGNQFQGPGMPATSFMMGALCCSNRPPRLLGHLCR